MSEPMQTRFRVGGMDCASCAAKVDTAVRRVPGVTDVSVSVTAGTMTVKHDESSDLDAIPRKLSGLGYDATPIQVKSKPTTAEPVQGVDFMHDQQQAHSHDRVGHEHGNVAPALPSQVATPEFLQARFRVGGMDCASCATKVDTAVRRMPGIEDISVSVTSGTMTVKHSAAADLKALEKQVSALGYCADHQDSEACNSRIQRLGGSLRP